MTAIYSQPPFNPNMIDTFWIFQMNFSCHTEILQAACLRCSWKCETSHIQTASTFTDNWPVFLPSSEWCVFQDKPDRMYSFVPSKHIYMDTRLYIICVSVLCLLWKKHPIFGTHTHTPTPRTVPGRPRYDDSIRYLLSGLLQIGHSRLIRPTPNPYWTGKRATVDR